MDLGITGQRWGTIPNQGWYGSTGLDKVTGEVTDFKTGLPILPASSLGKRYDVPSGVETYPYNFGN